MSPVPAVALVLPGDPGVSAPAPGWGPPPGPPLWAIRWSCPEAVELILYVAHAWAAASEGDDVGLLGMYGGGGGKPLPLPPAL